MPRNPRTWFVLSALLVVCLVVPGCSGGNAGTGSSGGTGPGGGGSAAAASFSSSSLTFTGVDSGYPTAAQTLTITNTGKAALVITSEQLQGADAAYFSGVGGGVGYCANTTIQPGDSCTSKVEFTPVAARSYSAQLAFTDNAASSPQSVTLSGTLGTSFAPTAKAQFGYVEDYSGAIYGFTISSSGTWTATSPASISTGDSAGAMVMDPLGKFLFTAGFLSGNVSSFSITPSTGVLVAAGTAPASAANNRPENMAIDPTGSFIYVSNTGIGTVTEYTVNRSNGALTEGGTVTVPLYPSIQPGLSEPGGLTTDASGKYLYVSESGYMAAYSVDPSTGALTPLTASNVSGGSCFNLHLDASGTYLYCADGNYGGISIYSIDSSTGALTGITEGYPISAGQSTTDIGVTLNDKYAYAMDRSGAAIWLYTDNSATGLLTAMTPNASLNQAGEPYAIAIDPGDQLAYVVLEAEGLNVMTINADGTLSYSSQVSINSPVAVAIYP